MGADRGVDRGPRGGPRGGTIMGPIVGQRGSRGKAEGPIFDITLH